MARCVPSHGSVCDYFMASSSLRCRAHATCAFGAVMGSRSRHHLPCARTWRAALKCGGWSDAQATVTKGLYVMSVKYPSIRSKTWIHVNPQTVNVYSSVLITQPFENVHQADTPFKHLCAGLSVNKRMVPNPHEWPDLFKKITDVIDHNYWKIKPLL